MDLQRGATSEGHAASDEEHARQAAGDHHASGGGARYQKAHRQNAVERDGPTRSRSARGTGPDHAAPRAPAGTDTRPEHRDGQPAAGQITPDHVTDDGQRVRPQPDDESWLQDLGYPKVGEHVESHATQIEHGPNAGGTQQGHDEAAAPGSPRRGERSP